MRHEGRVENRAVYVALGINLEGRKDVLGLWTSAAEGAKFWMNVLTELRSRGVRDIYLVCVDGLKGFPQAIETIYPKAQVQLCIVHLVRASLNYVTWQDRKKVVIALKPIYKATTADEAERQLSDFESQWPKYPAIARLWREQWERVIPFFSFPQEVRKVVYTTNAVESLHMSLRKIIKTRGSFPSEEAAFKLLYLALTKVVAKWETVQHWKQMLNHLDTVCSERIREAGIRQ
jgi:putative transposase